MFGGTPLPIARYGFAVIVSVLAFSLRYLLTPVFGDTGFPLIMFLLAIMLSALYGGLGPGLLTTGLSALIATYFTQPMYPLAVSTMGNYIGIIVFLLIGGVITFLTHVIKESRQRAENYAAALKEHITMLKRSETVLRGAEQELSDFFETATIGLHWVGADGVVLRVNQAELDMLGYSPDEYLGRHIAEFHADLPVIDDILNRLAKDEKLKDYPARMRCKDGSIKHVLINSSVLWEGGKFVHTRCFTRDVTERKQIEELQGHFAAIVECSDDAIVSKDLHSIIKSWNKGAERIFGYRAEEVIGHSIEMLIPPELKHDETHILDRIRQGERIEHYETIRLRKDGIRIPISLSVSPILNAAGEIIGAAKIARDITEKKLVQEKLNCLNQRLEQRVQERTRELEEANTQLVRQTDELTGINTELDRFAWVASHDLQEPLRLVSSFTQLLARRYTGKLDAEADEFIEFTLSGTERMRQLIRDLLNYSRLGIQQSKRQGVDCEEVLNEVLRNLKALIDQSGGVVTHAPLPTVFADPVQFCQLFQNLIGNALKFHSSELPRVHVSAMPMPGEKPGSAPYWQFSVKDNGIGIEPQYSERIFGAFQRLHTLDEFPGTGIGLAICKKVVVAHGGRIWVESTTGKGTTFKFTVPIVKDVETA